MIREEVRESKMNHGFKKRNTRIAYLLDLLSRIFRLVLPRNYLDQLHDKSLNMKF